MLTTKPKFNSATIVSDAINAVFGNTKEITRTRGKIEERQTRYRQLIAAGAFDDDSKASEAANLRVQIDMGTPAIARLEEREPALRAKVDYAGECGKAALRPASAQVQAALLANIDNALIVFIPDKSARAAMAAAVYGESVQAKDFYVHTNMGRYGEDEIRHAQRVVEDFEKFEAALKKHAALLPKGFAPFPETEAEFLALCPPRPVAPAPSSEPEETPEQRLAFVQSEQRLEEFRRALTNSDGYNAKRLWSFVSHRDRATLIHEQLDGALDIQQVDAVLKNNLGNPYDQALRAVRAVADEQLKKLETEHTAQVQD
jgi:hypothetical protein